MRNSIPKLLIGSILTGGVAMAQTAWSPQEDGTKIKVIAHRGEHLHHPENTMPAFQAAIDAGADYFELDVRTTSDGKFVIMHDNTLDRTTNGTGEVHKHTFDEIRALDAGAKFSSSFAGPRYPLSTRPSISPTARSTSTSIQNTQTRNN
jgi:glycerophosphoryl diester phosphodiesterase